MERQSVFMNPGQDKFLFIAVFFKKCFQIDFPVDGKVEELKKEGKETTLEELLEKDGYKNITLIPFSV